MADLLKNRRRGYGRAALFVTLLWSSTSWASAWTRPQFHFYLQLGTGFSFADNRYTNDGNTAPITVRKSTTGSDLNVSNYQQLTSDLYFEFGALDRLTIFGSLPFSSIRQRNDGADADIVYSVNKFADIMLGGRFGILKGEPFALALETRLVFPSGDPRSVIPTGSGDFRGELRIVASKALPKFPLWFNFEFGFTLRGTGTTNDPTSPTGTGLTQYAPELVLHADIGSAIVRWRQVDRLILIVSAEFRGSTVRTATSDALFSIIPANSEMTTVGATLMWYVYRGFGILGRFNQAVQGRRLPQVTSVGGALFFNWR